MALISLPSQSSNFPCSAPTPYISTEHTNLLQTDSGKADEQLLRYLSARNEVEQTLSRVDYVRAEGADWDDEEGQPIVLETARRAKNLLIDLARQAESAGKAWAHPAVSATPEGGIHFSWLIADIRVALTVFSPHRDTVCVSKFPGEVAQRELLSDYGAVQRVMRALKPSPLSNSGRNSR